MTCNIPTEQIRLPQINIVDPENHYKHIFKIQVELPADVSAKDRLGTLRSSGHCTGERAVEAGPEFVTEEVESLVAEAQALLTVQLDSVLEVWSTSKTAHGPADFALAPDGSHCVCPAGKRLYSNGSNCIFNGYAAPSAPWRPAGTDGDRRT